MKTKISQIFIPINSSCINIEEKFSSLLISDFEISNFKEISKETIVAIQNLIKKNDSVSLFVKVGNQDAILFDNLNNFEETFAKLQEEQLNFDNLEDCINIQIEINKDTNEIINIYDFESFTSFCETLSAKDILTLINKYKRNDNLLFFNVLDAGFEEFYSNNIVFSNTPENFVPPNKLIEISDNCHFNNYSNFPFNPYFFELKKRPSNNNPIIELLDRLSLVFCITSLFDITSIDGESNLYYKLNGYKSFENRLSINSLSTNSKNTYYKIFDWVYSDSSHISDKMGLARNILSLSLKNDNIEIDENVYYSIQSGFQTYLKDNIKNYIEIRSKVTDELSWISQKFGEIIKEYVGAYEKSLFIFLSFFISVFLFKFLKGDVNNIFTIDATVFSFSFLILSIVFLIYSHNKIRNEIIRLKRKYFNLKNRYLDLLNKEDINRILDNDNEFDYEINYINNRKKKNTLLWICTILILLLTVISLSYFENYSNSVKNNPQNNIKTNCQYPDSLIKDSLITKKRNKYKDSLGQNSKLQKYKKQNSTYDKNISQDIKDAIVESNE